MAISNLENQLVLTDAAGAVSFFRFSSDMLFFAMKAAGLLQNPVVAILPPATPARGDLWLDVSGPASAVPATAPGVWRVYDGASFVPTNPKDALGILPSFTGTTIPDGATFIEALQALETAIEQRSTAQQDFVNTIAERDALPSPSRADIAYVADASADPTVELGGALYAYDGVAWFKLAEFESLDLTFSSPTQLSIV